MCFLDLTKHGLKGRIKISYILGLQKRENRREGEKRRRKEEEEEEEEKKKRRRGEAKIKKGMELLNLSMDLWFV